jgi:hypothetical protein
MKVSSITANTIETALFSEHHVNPIIHFVKSNVAAFSKSLNQIGSAIELGEKGDLDAAHDLRIKNIKAKK